jgi:hypothetical protein
MPKPTIIDTPFPTVAEIARAHGVSTAERKRIERQVEELLRRDATAIGRSRRRALGRARAGKGRKK